MSFQFGSFGDGAVPTGNRALERVRQYLAHHPPQRISEPGTVEAAVAILLATGGTEEPAVLLIKRAENQRDPWSGQMALPGGRRESGDETLLDTARRETREETRIELSRGALIGELDDLHPRTPVLPPIVVRPFVFELDDRPPVRTNSEVTLHLWVSLATLKAGSATSSVPVRGASLRVPSYVVGDHVVWGMTERILKPIIDLSR